MDVIVGTYEELILGYKVDLDNQTYSFKQHFSDHQHTGCIKALAISNRGVLATGSTDETIKLFNLVKNKELGSLMQHTGSITDIKFKDNHMCTTSEDGTIIVWKAGKWEPIRTLRGHKGAVYSIDIHPSGKMALSVGKDRTLRTWNLINARCAFTLNLKNFPDRVVWSPEGTRYAVLYKMTVDVYDVQSGSVCASIKQGTNLCSLLFLEESVLAVGGEEGKIGIYSLADEDLEEITIISTETSRVKAMCSCPGESNSTKLLLTASSDGLLQLWKLDQSGDELTSELLSKADCNFRPTCLAIARHSDYQQPTAAQPAESVEESSETKTKTKPDKKKKRKSEQTPTEEETPAKKVKKNSKNGTKFQPMDTHNKKGKKYKNKKKKQKTGGPL